VVARFGGNIIGCTDRATNGPTRQIERPSIADVLQSMAPES